jgi:chromosome segregation protein
MHLKRLNVTGFKSFADNIKLDFEEGVTAVVGPNGCGKSNIIDAIRWSLGEMSPKSLRSSVLMDVVFNGSGSRPPQNLAEVILIFDNTDKSLPIDYPEVSIGRRLFRSGESEYFINKAQCRLRDIKELFYDTGMGEDGYSFMAQGKVEWILQAKPEERRELFEEAAGVSKYRSRREEAMRKLDRVEIDLSRLADIISVTQDQIRKLENAVNKAKNYQKVKEQLKKVEISDWLFQLENSDSDLKKVLHRLEEDQAHFEALNTQIQLIDSDLSKLRLENTQTEEELLKANGELNAVESNIKINEERQTHSVQRQSELESQLAKTKETIEREQKRIAELTQQETLQCNVLNQIKTEGETIETDYASSKYSHDQALINLEEKGIEVKVLRDTILERVQERTRIQQTIANLTSDVSRWESEHENRQKELTRIDAQIDEENHHLEANESQIKELKSQMESKSKDLEQLNLDSDKIEEVISQVRERILVQTEEIARIEGQIHSIQNQQSQDPYLAGVQSVVGQGFSGIEGPLGLLIQTQETDRDIVAATLGEHLDDLVANNIEEASQAIEFLKRERKGRARIWVLDRIPSQSDSTGLGEIPKGSFLSDRIQCEPKFRYLIDHLCRSLWVQESHIYGQGYVNGGVDPTQWKSHVPHRLPELERTLEKAEGQKAKFEKELIESINGRGTQAELRDIGLKEQEEVRIRLQVAEEERQKIKNRLDLLHEEKHIILVESAQVEEDKTKAKEGLKNSQDHAVELELQEQEDHAQLDIKQHELTELQQLHAQAAGDLSAKQERHNSYQEKFNWQNSIVEQLQKDVSTINNTILHYQGSIEQMNSDFENSKTNELEAKTQIELLLTEREKASELCSRIQAHRVTVGEKISALEPQLASYRRDLNMVQENIQSEKVEETAIKGRLETIHQRLMDQYEMTLDQAKNQFEPQTADPETLEKLKKRVSSMGPVNLAAPQEHAELLEKNEFLFSQQNDLLKAKSDLREVISKINATTREHFRETFQQVRENFRKLYSKLFQGGEADLHFTNEADILSTGIDIYCQPPGKKLLHISLLSGGEKAMTAIALLFAFFQVRPSPVALLDEVDAPLDDANVVRFVGMLHEFAKKSQFILITHNKRSMEAARSLYGVTMEELGVSKVISTRLVKEKKPIAAPEPARA